MVCRVMMRLQQLRGDQQVGVCSGRCSTLLQYFNIFICLIYTLFIYCFKLFIYLLICLLIQFLLLLFIIFFILMPYLFILCWVLIYLFILLSTRQFYFLIYLFITAHYLLYIFCYLSILWRFGRASSGLQQNAGVRQVNFRLHNITVLYHHLIGLYLTTWRCTWTFDYYIYRR